MKKIVLFILMFLLSACVSSYEINSNAHTLSSKLPNGLVKSFKKRINVNGLLEIEIILKSAFSQDIIYKINWLDEDGFVLKDAINQNYQTLRISAQQELILHKVAPDIRIKDFTIDIKTRN
ncbi:YcfL family protein [Campylobacter hepaticus]|uniref:DUF1425 domain-containing protein n=1 Tax=Campylobacter hepaticus TaxID=1813019 RepID=A0A424YYZ9_9BACT|nr:YcfL family protein [Campylobacter hepaticus]AXP09169.1 DUF1425 domain-containing protein [Campylobacter hepaticus]MCZ0771673.1 YcfL family protein [Campylobacter hepaticus]MCZ0773142.1 YcfL family protein [Campylobacter hepaticus]MCZ0775821.1 YcfL family protein [Campylobacter hepaticus]MDX2323406.1 YcfL family protein [Campylobacter hepaticus]